MDQSELCFHFELIVRYLVCNNLSDCKSMTFVCRHFGPAILSGLTLHFQEKYSVASPDGKLTDMNFAFRGYLKSMCSEFLDSVLFIDVFYIPISSQFDYFRGLQSL